VRIGVNGGSLNQGAGDAQDAGEPDKNLGKESEAIINDAWCSRRWNPRSGAGVRLAARPDYYFMQDFAAAARFDHRLSRPEREDGAAFASGPYRSWNGMKGQIWSAASLGVLLYQGIGDTIRISLTPRPGETARGIYAAWVVAAAWAAFVFTERDRLPRVRRPPAQRFKSLPSVFRTISET